MLPTVAIVGRPNVGKSTLFNRLIRRRQAIVQDDPGVTRDRHYGKASFDGVSFQLVDTGGFVPEAASGMDALIRAQTELAVEEADVVVLVMDSREGLTQADRDVAHALRRAGKPTLHVANKVEGPRQESALGEFYELGADKVFPISAEHALGMEELIDAVLRRLPEQPAPSAAEADSVRVALVGRPNAGKSSLLNRLCGEERVIVSDEPGTTRDPVDVVLENERHGKFTLVDTAGIRRKRRKSTTMERYAIVRALRSIDGADVACLVIDAAAGVTDQDAKIANMALEAGRGLVLALNKADLLGGDGATRKDVGRQVDDELHFVSFAPRVFISAETGRGLGQLLGAWRSVHAACGERVATADLNRFLRDAVAAHAPPSFRGRPVRLYFITQPTTRPPGFMISTNAPQGIPIAYRRYLANRLREVFGFSGAPLRLFLRQRGEREGVRSPRRRG